MLRIWSLAKDCSNAEKDAMCVINGYPGSLFQPLGCTYERSPLRISAVHHFEHFNLIAPPTNRKSAKEVLRCCASLRRAVLPDIASLRGCISTAAGRAKC
jgi:hypothetical protein